jgi:hypothetical protein
MRQDDNKKEFHKTATKKKEFRDQNTELNNEKQDENLHHGIISTYKPSVKNICI